MEGVTLRSLQGTEGGQRQKFGRVKAPSLSEFPMEMRHSGAFLGHLSSPNPGSWGAQGQERVQEAQEFTFASKIIEVTLDSTQPPTGTLGCPSLSVSLEVGVWI